MQCNSEISTRFIQSCAQFTIASNKFSTFILSPTLKKILPPNFFSAQFYLCHFGTGTRKLLLFHGSPFNTQTHNWILIMCECVFEVFHIHRVGCWLLVRCNFTLFFLLRSLFGRFSRSIVNVYFSFVPYRLSLFPGAQHVFCSHQKGWSKLDIGEEKIQRTNAVRKNPRCRGGGIS